jgi:hypothetical protein
MSEVSRPLQVVLVLALAFGGLWFVALRPKTDSGGAPPPAATQPAKPAPHKSSLPGGLGRAVDKAKTTKQQGDAQAAATDRAGSAPETGSANQTVRPTPAPVRPTPAPVRPAPAPVRPAPASRPAVAPAPASAPSSPAALGGSVGASVARSQNAAISAAAAAVGMVSATLLSSLSLPVPVARAEVRAPVRPVSSPPTRPAPAQGTPSVTPAMVRHALADGDVVVLLFWGSNSSDDRLVRSELSQVDRRGGRVHAWPVAVRGLARFKNVLRGIDVVQSPTVIVMAKGADPRVLEGYTDHAEIDQATLLALTRA